MKKLLILAAILFMAPIAGAMTVSLTDTGTTVELSVFEYEPIYSLAMVIEAPGVLSNFVDGSEAPIWIPHFITINGDDGEGYVVMSTPPYDDGVWLIADWSASIPVRISAYEEFVPGVGILLDQIIVPEPATLALLCLGSLFLTRHRR
jgi:hypothetical protein